MVVVVGCAHPDTTYTSLHIGAGWIAGDADGGQLGAVNTKPESIELDWRNTFNWPPVASAKGDTSSLNTTNVWKAAASDLRSRRGTLSDVCW